LACGVDNLEHAELIVYRELLPIRLLYCGVICLRGTPSDTKTPQTAAADAPLCKGHGRAQELVRGADGDLWECNIPTNDSMTSCIRKVSTGEISGATGDTRTCCTSALLPTLPSPNIATAQESMMTEWM
jgi:hypothetical protein